MPRFLIYFAPILVVVTGGFSVLNIITAIGAFRVRNYPVGGISLGMGVAGIALSVAVWRVLRRMRQERAQPQVPPKA